MYEKYILLAVIVIVIVWLLIPKSETASPGPITEGYGIVGGAISSYKNEIAECSRRCRQADPRSRLYPGSNIGCDQYCENLFTAYKKVDVPPEKIAPAFQSTIDKCNVRCGVDVEKLKNYSPSDIPPPFALLDNSDIVLPMFNPGYIRTNLERNQQRRCVDDCVGQYNVAQWCKVMGCPYALENEEECMGQCIAMHSTYNSQATWNWDFSNR